MRFDPSEILFSRIQLLNNVYLLLFRNIFLFYVATLLNVLV